MIQLLHQRQQQTDLAGWEALASEPIEVLSGQVGDQPAFVLAVRHDACNQQLQVFVVHLNGLPLLIHPKKRSCHSAHASIHLAAQGTQHERSGHQFGGKPFPLSSPHSGRIEGSASFQLRNLGSFVCD
jgi:hypothetical protein